MLKTAFVAKALDGVERQSLIDANHCAGARSHQYLLLTWVVFPFAGTTADLRQESVDDDDDDVEREEEEEVEIVSEFLGRECKDRVVFASPLLPAIAPHPCFAGRTSRGGKLPDIDQASSHQGHLGTQPWSDTDQGGSQDLFLSCLIYVANIVCN